MHNINLRVSDKAYREFIEIVSNIEEIEIIKDETEDEILANFREGLKELKRAKENPNNLKSMEQFLDEL
jgi:hypothetical protein